MVGNANYNLAEDISELSYLLLTLPTLENNLKSLFSSCFDILQQILND